MVIYPMVEQWLMDIIVALTHNQQGKESSLSEVDVILHIRFHPGAEVLPHTQVWNSNVCAMQGQHRSSAPPGREPFLEAALVMHACCPPGTKVFHHMDFSLLLGCAGSA